MNEQQLINLINRIIDHRLFGFAPGGRLRLDGPNLGQVPATNLPDPLVRDRIFSEVELGAGTGSSSGSAPFLVDDEGDIVAIRNIPYHWPTEQGEAGMGLVNDGAGNLTWSLVASEGGGSSSSCTLMQLNKTVSPDPDGVEDTFTVEGGEYLSGTLMVTVNGQVQSSGSSLDFIELDPGSGTFQFMASSIPQIGDIIRVFYGLATAQTVNNYTTNNYYESSASSLAPQLYVWQTFFFSVEGNLSTGAKALRIYVPSDYTIDRVFIAADTAPAGAAIIVDVNKSGTTIFTTQANRPTIADGANTGESGTPDVAALTKNDYLTFDIDQVGFGTAGADLTVHIRCKHFLTAVT